MKRPELLATVYGNALGESLGDATAIEMATGLGGIEQHRFSAFNSARHEFRFAVLFCTADQQQYLLVAFNTERKRKRPALDQLLDQVGCPSEAPGSYRSRPNACDQGIQALCD
jgi:hypothetical protein